MPSVATRGRGRRTINEINMVPFIDVMLVLLIIFMVTAPLITPSVIDLPSVGKASKQPDRVVQIVVREDESLELREGGDKATARPVKLDQLAAAVRSAGATPASAASASSETQTTDSQTAVVISADRKVRYEVVVKVMDTLQRAGIARVGLSVQLVP